MEKIFEFFNLEIYSGMNDPKKPHMNKVKLIFLKKSENYREISRLFKRLNKLSLKKVSAYLFI